MMEERMEGKQDVIQDGHFLPCSASPGGQEGKTGGTGEPGYAAIRNPQGKEHKYINKLG